EDAVRREARGELAKTAVIEARARLRGIGRDLVKRDLAESGHHRGSSKTRSALRKTEKRVPRSSRIVGETWRSRRRISEETVASSWPTAAAVTCCGEAASPKEAERCGWESCAPAEMRERRRALPKTRAVWFRTVPGRPASPEVETAGRPEKERLRPSGSRSRVHATRSRFWPSATWFSYRPRSRAPRGMSTRRCASS